MAKPEFVYVTHIATTGEIVGGAHSRRIHEEILVQPPH